MPTNLPLKKSLKFASAQPKVTSNYRSLAATVTVTKLADENINRKELIVTNTSTALLYISFGNLPSATDYVVALPNQATLLTESTDRINGVWASAAGGQANITERI